MHWIRELRRASRTLARTPSFALAGILVLAIGIAAVTTLFGLVHAVLLEPLTFPVRDARCADGTRPAAYGDRRGWKR